VQLERLLDANRRLQQEFERHNASEAAWRQEKALLLAMINQVPDYLFAKDRNNFYLMANDACAHDLGVARGVDMIGRTDTELGHDPEVVRKFIEDDQAVIQSEKARINIDEFMITSTGDKKWLSTSKLPLRNEQGKVIGMVGVARDVTDRKEAEERIHYLAFHDTLTGLPNRFLFEQRLEQAVAAAANGRNAALLYLDLDHFKIVNDTLGHPAGDELIRQVAGRLSAVVEPSDTVARLGGDEFAIVMADCRRPDLPEKLSRRIVGELSRPFELFGDPVYIDVSIGIAFSRNHLNASEMLRQADIALYRAKAHGGGRYELFAEGMAAAVLENRQVEQDLRKALAEGTGLVAVYQPIFDVEGTSILGAEALVRWEHPTRGMLGPGAFIRVAEERGLIENMGEVMLRLACAHAKKTGLPWVAVNVSPVQFRNEHFAETILTILNETDLEPHRLQLEITEGMLLESPEAVQGTLAKLRTRGVKVALDDFGTGYSSMNYLRRYNVDKLKIDRSFVAQLGMSDDADAIVAAIIGLARAMRMTVTAEGVETEVQHEKLLRMGCQEFQGFYFSGPMGADALAKRWTDQNA
jgi:diguanylate cyclase (GGDEF)-like protein/PAS domain S-box-containing protein